MRFFRRIYEYWMAFGLAIGVVMTPIQLFLIYLLVFGPARLITAVLRVDPLGRRPKSLPSFWSAKEQQEYTVETTRHQF